MIIPRTQRPLSELPQRNCDVVKSSNERWSVFFRKPEWFRQLASHMKDSATEFPQPYFVLSAGCGKGHEAVSIVITWLEFLEREGVKKEEFPLVVIALDLLSDNLESLNSGEYFLYGTRFDMRRFSKYFSFPPSDELRLVVKDGILDHVFTTQMDLRNFSDLRTLSDFTPEGRGFDAILCNNVGYQMDEPDIWEMLSVFRQILHQGLLLFDDGPRNGPGKIRVSCS